MKLSFVLIVAFIQLHLNSFKSEPYYADAILGKWYCEEMDQSTFEVKKNDKGVYSATVIRSSRKESIGKVVFKDGVFLPQKKVWKGMLNPPTRNIEVEATFSLLNDTKLKLEGKVFFMSKTFYWQRKE